MKIALVVHFFPPNYLSGTEIASFHIAKSLAQRGHKVHVLTWFNKGMPKKVFQDGFYIHRVFGKNIRFISPVVFWIKIFLGIRSIHPDVVHIQNIRLAIPAFFSKKFFKTPYVIYSRGSEPISDLGFFNDRLFKASVSNANRVIVLTHHMKEALKNIYSGDIIVVPNGIDLTAFNNLSKNHMQDMNKKSILFIGRILPIKGLEYLIKAMGIIQKENPDISLTIIGEGSQQPILERLVRDAHLEKNVFFKGKIQNKEVPMYLSQADVFVLPSLSEGFPNVLLEAMAAGLPVVTTNIGGLSEIITNEENGYLVEPKNPEQLSQYLLKILKDPEIQKIMSKNNIQKAKRYSWESVASELEKVYFSVVKTVTKKND